MGSSVVFRFTLTGRDQGETQEWEADMPHPWLGDTSGWSEDIWLLPARLTLRKEHSRPGFPKLNSLEKTLHRQRTMEMLVRRGKADFLALGLLSAFCI